MATTPQISTKHVAILKANARMMIVVSVAVFITIFSLVAAKSIFSQVQYQVRVTSAKSKANTQLKQNIQAFQSLVTSYNSFDSAQTNIIGGSLNGTGANDGENAKIVLDALPSTYDFPALASSLENLLSNNGYTVTSLTGTDQQVLYQTNPSSSTPQAVSIPFGFSVNNTNYQALQQLVTKLQSSIRPMGIDTMTISGGGGSMTLSITAHTYFEPGKSVTIGQEVIK